MIWIFQASRLIQKNKNQHQRDLDSSQLPLLQTKKEASSLIISFAPSAFHRLCHQRSSSDSMIWILPDFLPAVAIAREKVAVRFVSFKTATSKNKKNWQNNLGSFCAAESQREFGASLSSLPTTQDFNIYFDF